MQIKRVVRKIANAAMPSLPGNPAVLNADNAVGKLGDFVVVGNHYQRLMEFVAFGFQNPQYIAARSAVQVAGGLVSKTMAGLETRARAMATRCYCPPNPVPLTNGIPVE